MGMFLPEKPKFILSNILSVEDFIHKLDPKCTRKLIDADIDKYLSVIVKSAGIPAVISKDFKFFNTKFISLQTVSRFHDFQTNDI